MFASIYRGPGATWKPHVTPVGNIPSPNIMSSAPSAVTKTSLAHTKPAGQPIGTGHNLTPRPFSGASTPQVINETVRKNSEKNNIT